VSAALAPAAPGRFNGGVPQSWWERISRVDAVSAKGQFVFLCLIMGFATLVNTVIAVLMMSWIPILAALAGWGFVLIYGLVRSTAFEKAGKGVGAVLVPSGSSTPSVNQHSNIQAMVARGEYRKAADAFRAVIESDAADVVACEQLGQVALRELKDYELAVFAYREAEKRSGEPRRRAGYALLVAGIYRDNVGNAGRAIVELRRVIERYPGIPNVEALRAELEELKARHFEEQ
jgi:tetratricopeptide (TPR) repeat protein